MKPTYPDTSIEAYQSLPENKRREIYFWIMVALEEIGEGTYEMIARQAGKEESVIWKRLKEMEDLQLIHRPGKKLPTKTGRNAFVWRIGTGTNVETVYKKGISSAGDIAINIIEHAINKSYVQPKLFSGED